MVIKHTKDFNSKAFQNLPKLLVWFKSKPSGNPGKERYV
jgi:hypothetical protein